MTDKQIPTDTVSDANRTRATLGPEKTLRRAGGRWAARVSAPKPGTPPWRIKVDEWEGRDPGSTERHGMYGVSHNLLSHPREGRLPDSPDPVNEEWSRHYVFPATELDEVVVGRWGHLEQMDTGRWWANFGGVTLWVEADREGRPTSVSVFGPLDYDRPVPGCSYSVDWHDEGLVSARSHEWLLETVRGLVQTRGQVGKAAEQAWRRAEVALPTREPAGNGDLADHPEAGSQGAHNRPLPTRSEVEAAVVHDDHCRAYGVHRECCGPDECGCTVAEVLSELIEHGWLQLAEEAGDD